MFRNILTIITFVFSVTFFSKTILASNYTDAEILNIVETANNGEIDTSKIALNKSKNPAVTELAKQMVNAHSDNNKKLADLCARLKVKKDASATSNKLKADAGAKKLKLKALTGNTFDKSYVNTQIDMHKTVLETLDDDLIPNAKNADVRNFLTETRQAVANHLEHARDLRDKL